MPSASPAQPATLLAALSLRRIAQVFARADRGAPDPRGRRFASIARDLATQLPPTVADAIGGDLAELCGLTGDPEATSEATTLVACAMLAGEALALGYLPNAFAPWLMEPAHAGVKLVSAAWPTSTAPDDGAPADTPAHTAGAWAIEPRTARSESRGDGRWRNAPSPFDQPAPVAGIGEYQRLRDHLIPALAALATEPDHGDNSTHATDADRAADRVWRLLHDRAPHVPIEAAGGLAITAVDVTVTALAIAMALLRYAARESITDGPRLQQPSAPAFVLVAWRVNDSDIAPPGHAARIADVAQLDAAEATIANALADALKLSPLELAAATLHRHRGSRLMLLDAGAAAATQALHTSVEPVLAKAFGHEIRFGVGGAVLSAADVACADGTGAFVTTTRLAAVAARVLLDAQEQARGVVNAKNLVGAMATHSKVSAAPTDDAIAAELTPAAPAGFGGIDTVSTSHGARALTDAGLRDLIAAASKPGAPGRTAVVYVAPDSPRTDAADTALIAALGHLATAPLAHVRGALRQHDADWPRLIATLADVTSTDRGDVRETRVRKRERETKLAPLSHGWLIVGNVRDAVDLSVDIARGWSRIWGGSPPFSLSQALRVVDSPVSPRAVVADVIAAHARAIGWARPTHVAGKALPRPVAGRPGGALHVVDTFVAHEDWPHVADLADTLLELASAPEAEPSANGSSVARPWLLAELASVAARGERALIDGTLGGNNGSDADAEVRARADALGAHGPWRAALAFVLSKLNDETEPESPEPLAAAPGGDAPVGVTTRRTRVAIAPHVARVRALRQLAAEHRWIDRSRPSRALVTYLGLAARLANLLAQR